MSTESLKELCGKYGIKVHIAECKALEKPVSSTLLRKLIASGEMEEAAKYLGRQFSVTRKVEHGENIGHKLGFPTANIQLPDFHVVPKFGVYITKAKVGGKWYKAITNVGGKPTVGTNKPCIETYMLDFENDIYGEEIEIEFYHYLRPISKFENIEALKKQLAQDKESARVYFNEK